MDTTKEQKALNAYIKFLQARQVSEEAVEVRTRFLEKLIIVLHGKTTREGYGDALNTISKFEFSIERHQQLNIAREFFPFWMNDLKLIARMRETYGYDLSISQFKPLATESIVQLNDDQFDADETDLLNSYAQLMQEQNQSQEVLLARLRSAKLVLLHLRDIPIKNNVTYRMAVEVTLALFNDEEAKQNILVAVREFFYIWIAKADPVHAPMFVRG